MGEEENIFFFLVLRAHFLTLCARFRVPCAHNERKKNKTFVYRLMQGHAHKCYMYFHPYELLVDFKITWSILSNTKIKVDLSCILLLSEMDIQA